MIGNYFKVVVSVHSMLKYHRLGLFSFFRFSGQEKNYAYKQNLSKNEQRMSKMSQSDAFLCLECKKARCA